MNTLLYNDTFKRVVLEDYYKYGEILYVETINDNLNDIIALVKINKNGSTVYHLYSLFGNTNNNKSTKYILCIVPDNIYKEIVDCVRSREYITDTDKEGLDYTVVPKSIVNIDIEKDINKGKFNIVNLHKSLTNYYDKFININHDIYFNLL